MHKSEIESYEDDQKIVSLGFLSATCDRSIPEIYVSAREYSKTDSCPSVLFEIQFTIGSYFNVLRVRYDTDRSIWIVGRNEGYERTLRTEKTTVYGNHFNWFSSID